MTNNTTQRSIRIPDDLWQQVQSQAAQDHINVSGLVRGLLRGWLDQDNKPRPRTHSIEDVAAEFGIDLDELRKENNEGEK